MKATVPAGMARKKVITYSRHAKINTSGSTSSSKLQITLLNWLCKKKMKIVVSLHNIVFILISRFTAQSQAKVAYTIAFRHKRIHNCITQSKASRSIMAANAGNVLQLRAILTSHTIAPSRCCTVHCTPLQQLWIYDSFDDCWFAKQCSISIFKMSIPTDFQNL